MSSPTSILSYDLASWDISSGKKTSSNSSSSSPSSRRGSTTSNTNKDDTSSSPITLQQLIQKLPPLLHTQNAQINRMTFEERLHFDTHIRGTELDPVNQLFGRLNLHDEGLKKYALFDDRKNYTRNLIATDDETFTLLLLCWNADKESPIHDHPCDGCWVRLCQGRVRETRYEANDETDTLEVTSDIILEDDAPTFINDIIGYHKVGNPDRKLPAITLHLYCPPFQKCKIWLNSGGCSSSLTESNENEEDYDGRNKLKVSQCTNANVCFHSEYGVKHCDLCNDLFEVVNI